MFSQVQLEALKVRNNFAILSKDVVYNGFFKILKYRVQHKLFNGGVSAPYSRELFDRGHAVAVLLHDPNADKVVLIEQFRIGAIESDNPWVVELVAGMVEAGESVEEVAKREVMEECGAEVGDLHFIAEYYNSVGGSSEVTSLYYSKIDADKFEGIHGLRSENEDIRIVKISTDDFIKKLKQNVFRSATLITAGFWFMANATNY